MQLFNLIKLAQEKEPTEAEKAAIKKQNGASKPIKTVVEEEEFILEVSNSEKNDRTIDDDDQIVSIEE